MRVIFHVDMDSFFASCEQQACQSLRGRPIVVCGKQGSRSVIVASSREAKKLGIKTGMLPFEAKKIYPAIIFVEPDGAKYENISRRLIVILKKYTEAVEVFSIDEAFLDMTGYVKTEAEAVSRAKKIKIEIVRELGEVVTASVGIAGNKLLAKLASDINKPDGLFLINEQNQLEVLNYSKLTDFCGIGRRLEKHLLSLGIDSVIKLREQPLVLLQQIFGSFCGQKLYNMARGLDDSPVTPYFIETAVKSVGRSYTLPRNTFDKQEILVVLLHLCEKVGRELRRLKLTGRTVVIYWRYADFTHAGARQTFARHLNDSAVFFQFGEAKISKFRLARAVRLVGIQVSNLQDAGFCQLPLWLADRKRTELIPFLDKINDRYGELTVKPAFLLKLNKLRKKVGGFRLRD